MEMLPNEFRLGNYVNSVLINEVQKIDLWALRVIEEGNYQNSYHPDQKVFEPIPITETLLIKLGFDFYPNLGRRKFMNIGNLIIETNSNDNFPVYYTIQKELICFIKYIHQLQNLYFALVGEELTFKEEEL
jgi:hypothetical protein